MQAERFSWTAEVMALFRAMESARPAGHRLFFDAFADVFLRRSLKRVVLLSKLPLLGSALRWAIDHRWPGARSSGIARTRLIDDWVCESVSAGTGQIVILGAGFDTRAWRLHALTSLPVFEVDHPATSAEKRRRMARTGADMSRVRFVAIDFDHASLSDGLREAEFDNTKPTTAIWEGVTNYLTPEAVDSVMRWAGNLAGRSRLIFTYVHERVLTSTVDFEGASKVLETVARAGEPWTFGLCPEALPRYLEERGLRLIEDLGADDYRARYMGARRRRDHGYSFYRAAMAQVAGARA